jgi:hypothetical protein
VFGGNEKTKDCSRRTERRCSNVQRACYRRRTGEKINGNAGKGCRMEQDKPSLDEFKANIEEIFGQKLTTPAAHAAEDFWNNWSSFSSLISRRSLSAGVDMLMLTHNFPEYKRYNIWRGAGIVIFIIGLVCFFFSWMIGIVVVAFGAGFYYWGGRVMVNDAKNFAEKLMKEATLNPSRGGYAELCAHYIGGTIQLVSASGSAHWPQYPSNVISGERTFIET